MPYATTPEGLKVYYEKHGEGPALTLSSGGGGNHAIWWQSVTHLRDRYTVITLDYPGFGLTEDPSGDFDVRTWHTAIKAVLDDAGVEKSVVLGQSLGGQPALSFAVENPDRVSGLILTSSIGGISDPEVRQLFIESRERAEKLSVMDRLISKKGQEENPEKLFLFQALGTFNQGRAGGRNPQGSREGGTTLADVQKLIDAGVGLWIVYGDDDAVRVESSYQRVAELLPGSNLVLIPGGSHSFYWESPDEFNGAVEKILESVYGKVAA